MTNPPPTEGKSPDADLRERIAELEEGLKPFATEYHKNWSGDRIMTPDGDRTFSDGEFIYKPVTDLTVGDLRRAASLLSASPPASEPDVVASHEDTSNGVAAQKGDNVSHNSEPDKQALINHMVERFLAWRLPANFCPDGGISFKADYNEHTDYLGKHEPCGTNLFDAQQAKEMVRAMLSGYSAPVLSASEPNVVDWRG